MSSSSQSHSSPKFTVPNLTIEQLPKEVIDELSDPKLGGRRHYSRRTYNSGCRGPLCRAVERDRARRKTEQRCAREGRPYIPNQLKRIELEEEIMMMRVIKWYNGEQLILQTDNRGMGKPLFPQGKPLSSVA